MEQSQRLDYDGLFETAQATIAALTEALECALLEKPLPNGEYAHHAACNGDRRKPAGTVGVSCSCRVGKATIAALQADVEVKDRRIWELESWLQVKSPQEITLMESKIIQLEQQLTQRTAECDALKLVNDTHMKTVMKLSHVVEQRTAELEAAKDKVQFLEKKNRNLLDSSNMVLKVKADQDVRLDDLQAELERGRGLVRALPAYKDISVSHRIDENDYESWHVWVDHNPLAECDTEEEANAIKALYEHRQGMEG